MGHPEQRPEDPAAKQTTVPRARWSGAVRRSHPRFNVACALTLQPAGTETTITVATAAITPAVALRVRANSSTSPNAAPYTVKMIELKMV